jgi:hypothetical protein
MTAHPAGSDIMAAWRAGFTRRWHSNPDMAQFDDPVCGHSGRVAVLACLLFPHRPQVIRAAVLHDLGEGAVGDMNGEAKRRNPDLAQMLHDLESDAMRDIGVPYPNLSATESDALRLCDLLDAWLFMMLRAPQLQDRPDWRACRHDILRLAISLGVADAVERLIGAPGLSPRGDLASAAPERQAFVSGVSQ